MPALAERYQRYLRVLGIDGLPKGLEGLRLIVQRHLYRVPFENVSKLLLYRREGAGRLITLDEFLDGIEFQDLGGTCYTANPFLAELLRAVGYDASLLGCDMTGPDVHTAIHVQLDGRIWHVDGGYGAPFRQPLALDELPSTFGDGEKRYVLDHAPGGRWQVAEYRDGRQTHGYVVHLPAREREYFRDTIVASYLPQAAFMTRLRLVRIFEDHSVELFNRTLILNQNGTTERVELISMEELRAAVSDSLAMPRCPIETAIEQMVRLTGEPLFPGPAPEHLEVV